MQRRCDRCTRVYSAKTSRSRFCSAKCRVDAARARKAGLPEAIAEVVDLPSVTDGVLTRKTAAQLVAAERLEAPLGEACLALARRIDSGTEHGTAVAALVRELRTTLEAALDGAKAEPDELDELEQRRRDRARRAGFG